MFTHTPVEELKLQVIQSNTVGRLYVTPNGNKYPSITTVLGDGDKPWLTAWRESLGEKRAAKETKRTADRGEAVHLMIENYLKNDSNPTKNQKQEHITEFNSIRLRLKKVDKILLQEGALYSDILRVAGRVDCVGEYDGVLSIIDFKTSTNDKSESMIEDYFLQATAYALMFEEQYGINIEQVVIMMTTERGIIPLVFKKQIHEYVEPLVQRINTYYTKRNER